MFLSKNLNAALGRYFHMQQIIVRININYEQMMHIYIKCMSTSKNSRQIPKRCDQNYPKGFLK